MILLASHHHDDVSAHSEEEYPNECCGLLIGHFSRNGSKTVGEVRPILNAREREAKHHRFLIPPEEFRLAERQAAEKGMEVIGFYHSHPDHPAVPSQYDLEHAWPAFSYIVVSVRHGHTSDVRSWELQADRTAFSEEEIKKGN